MVNTDSAIRNVFTEVMVFDSNMFGPRSELRTLGDLDAADIILKYFAVKFWLGVMKLKNGANFLHKIHKRKRLTHSLR